MLYSHHKTSTLHFAGNGYDKGPIVNHTDTSQHSEPLDPLSNQPLEILERDGVRYTILGTAHVSKSSADAVEHLIATGDFDAVAIELDANRHAALTDADRFAKLDLFQIIRQGKAGMIAVNLALGAFQQRIAEQFGVEPGQEMRVAIRAAKDARLPLLLIDRDIGITLRRVYRSVPWWQRLTIFSGLIASLFSNEKITEDDIEKLKQGDMLESTFTEFAESSEQLYTPLINERDRYMAAKLREKTQGTDFQKILVVIGAGHLRGLREALASDEHDPKTISQELEQLPPPSVLPKLLPWIIVTVVFFGFYLGFRRSPELGFQLLSDWFFINGGLAAIGAGLGLAHPLTIIATFFAAPFTSLNPLIGAGFVAAGLELWLRKPNVQDFGSLRKDVAELKGWWRNRVARTLLVFFLVTLGSAAGTYLAGFRIFGRLFA